MHCHISIDYDEGVPDSYRAVVIKGDNAIRFESGDPQADWAEAMAFAKEHKLHLLEASSINHFVFDNIEWRFKEGEDGHEYLVPEERPEWREEKAWQDISVSDMFEALEDEPYESGLALGELGKAMGIEQGEELDYLPWEGEFRDKFTAKWISQWICHDTPVGSRAIYFEGFPLAIEHQQYRKSTPDYVFVKDAFTYDRAFNTMAEALMPEKKYDELPKLEIDDPMPHRYVERDKFSGSIRKLIEERIADQGPAPTAP